MNTLKTNKKILLLLTFIILSSNCLAAGNLKKVAITIKFPTLNVLNNEGKLHTLKFNKSLKKYGFVINFWATWCAPCKKEMPSLDKLKTLNEFKNINIIPINIGGDSYKKSKEFFEEIKIKNLDIFTGSGPEFSQLFKLRGLPTTILIDRNGFEVGRIVGYIDFNDQSLLDWLPKNL